MEKKIILLGQMFISAFYEKNYNLKDDDWAIVDNKSIHIYHGKNKVEEISITIFQGNLLKKWM